ncbi:hypothetical protein BGZ81_002078, partial [Podila clonocystis]
MARSTLFTFLMLVALIQVALAIPFGYNLVINVAGNGALKAYQGKKLIVEPGNLQGPYNMWGINRFEEGASIFMPPAGAYLSVADGNVALERRETKWYFEQAGFNVYKIKLPNEDLVLDWNEDSEVVSLQPSNGSPEQLWRVQDPYGYSRMYRHILATTSKNTLTTRPLSTPSPRARSWPPRSSSMWIFA